MLVTIFFWDDLRFFRSVVLEEEGLSVPIPSELLLDVIGVSVRDERL